jgi:two-component system response regulator PilR (NtrC family)
MSTLENKMIPRILVVDDEAHLRELLEITLIKMGLHVDSAESLEVARHLLSKNSYSLVLTDMRLPDGLGLELVEEVNTQYKNTPIAVITAFGNADNAVGALKAGAFDYVSKPVALDQLRKLVRDALELNNSKDPKENIRANTKAETTSFLLGSSPEIANVRSQIEKLARSMAPVMIAGESGSGKELAAREIHRNSIRADKPFIAVNCGAIPEMLMEAEFFGYRKGAFTGANEERDGFFQAANGGTLLLDEVADLPLAMQVKLLRAIQERRVRKVGATTEESVDVRILSATHQNLNACVESGKFRQDLYYRLNVIELSLPALRQRLSDIPILAQAILKRIIHVDSEMRLNNAAISALSQYDFPGNVRELENILERAAAFSEDHCIDVIDLDLRSHSPIQLHSILTPIIDTIAISVSEVSSLQENVRLESKTSPQSISVLSIPNVEDKIPSFVIPTLPYSLPEYLAQVESELIRIALKKTRNNRTQAAELLGVSFRQLRYSIQKLKIYED